MKIKLFALIVLVICLDFTLYGFGRAAAITGDLLSVIFSGIIMVIVNFLVIDFVLRKLGLYDEKRSSVCRM